MIFYRPSVKNLFFALALAFVMTAPAGVLAQEVVADPNPDAQPEVVLQPGETDHYVYQPRGRRDPFTPLIKREDPAAVIQTARRPEALRGPLERYELRQLRLIAVMVVKGDPRAMVAAPDGKSYTVKIDDYIGIDGGRVKAIQTRAMGIDENGVRVEKNPDRIIVEEVGTDSLTGKTVKEERYVVL